MKNSNQIQPKIFIVEDDKFYANIIRHQLLNDGYEDCTMLYSGYELLDKVHLSPDIIFLDYNMEDMNGVETLRQLKSINPNIQVVFLSGQEDVNISKTITHNGDGINESFIPIEVPSEPLDYYMSHIKSIKFEI